ncbi:metal-dependent transcriptional regulator [Thermophilibacter provencensis]|uniref:Manganese transport regulator n=1 Tax=Thermophilibacter provencensis TaxID=1852386 RepID=A0ABT7V2A3_9ACTN|nr:metal-dependent transcriptional regulator [Thermophilibacter provencensis]MDM8270732.1 metal-dependent transcriptional regulator [Thermophilibacter provencensis]
MNGTTSQEDHALSRASEDYLEAIYRLSTEGASADGTVRSVDVADQLGVSKASVNKALSTLKESGMVTQSRYGRVTLTEEGREYAALVWRAHRALRLFLESDLGVKPEVADEEACLMEHVLSADTMSRLIGYLEGQGIVVPE